MKAAKILLCFTLSVVSLLLPGCRRNCQDVLEDSRSCGRHMGRGVRTLGGKHSDSRQICDADDFYGPNGNPSMGTYADQGFIPLQDERYSDEIAMADTQQFRQARETPGDPGSSIPGIEAFQDPSTNPQLAGVFHNIYFELNSSLIKGQENLENIRNVANYLKSHHNTYIFVEGHTDERGPEAFNLALGSHRSNAVRNLLIQEGASADNIFTISYGKERPVVMDHHEEAWSKNRRAEFKVYQR